VSDNGIGMNPEECESVFEIFQRLNKNETEYPGKGLGLALSEKKC